MNIDHKVFEEFNKMSMEAHGKSFVNVILILEKW